MADGVSEPVPGAWYVPVEGWEDGLDVIDYEPELTLAFLPRDRTDVLPWIGGDGARYGTDEIPALFGALREAYTPHPWSHTDYERNVADHKTGWENIQ